VAVVSLLSAVPLYKRESWSENWQPRAKKLRYCLAGNALKAVVTSATGDELEEVARGCMSGRSPQEVTSLLRAWSAGDEEALRELLPLLYQELHRAARRSMAGERSGHTLQTTALINEVYVRLVDLQRTSWQNRAHFLAICARLMRRILIDSARARRYQKRGGAAPHFSFNEALFVSAKPATDLVALDDALKQLAVVDERKSRVVELRFFGGLTIKETAEVLKVSSDTVMRDWELAKAWLLREVSGNKRHEG
jgi:RNA polymerase sigma-70 factor, ECF subfamily